ncbi:MAG: filamentous hemagglutinin N-terminal domain-containing protein [Cyanobacteria bacterium P01_G01_bin.38]
MAQVIPDNSLGDESSLVSGSSSIQIDGGAQRGGNLFHSFIRFSVPQNGTVLFNNALSIQRIFGRVTGGIGSEIDGLIQANGSADLFLINPSGITFGPNATLRLGGSFIGTTASELELADGGIYTTNLESPFLLTNSIPVGLGFNQAAPISVQNEGHTIIGNALLPISEEAPIEGLSISPNNTFALLGSDIDIDGGIIRAPGRIELGAIQSGTVDISPAQSGWEFSYDNDSQFGGISLTRLSFVDASSFLGGQINLQGQQIKLADSSVVYTTAFNGEQSNAQIQAVASSLRLDGEVVSRPFSFPEGIPTFDAIPFIPATLLLDNFGTGNPGSIKIEVQNLVVTNGAGITTRAFSAGVPGDVLITADRIDVIGHNSVSEAITSSIQAENFGEPTASTVEGGRLFIDVGQFNVLDGATVGANTFSAGDSGVVDIKAEDILLSGSTPNALFPAQIGSSSIQAGVETQLGDAGTINIETGSLRVVDGAVLGTSTNNSGNAGSVTILADEFVEVGGGFNGIGNGFSAISSRGLLLAPTLSELLASNSMTTGDAGAVRLSTPRLLLRDGGSIGVGNLGLGDAGNLIVDSEVIRLVDGELLSSTTEGSGGDLSLFTESLFLQNSNITSSAGGSSNGGNINISSDVIALVENSQISANAQLGSGGQVVISTTGLFQDPSSTITATSAAGPQLDGTVLIQSPEVDLSRAGTLDSPIVQPPQTSSICAGRQDAGRSEFVVTGTGGVPISPDAPQRSYSGWSDAESSSVPDASLSEVTPSTIVEAQGFAFNPDGTFSLALVADNAVLQSESGHRQNCLSNVPGDS